MVDQDMVRPGAKAVLFGWEGNHVSQTLWYIRLSDEWSVAGRCAPRLCSSMWYGILDFNLLLALLHMGVTGTGDRAVVLCQKKIILKNFSVLF